VELDGVRAVLLGLGARTNVSLARYLARHGARVTLSDLKPADQLTDEIKLVGDLPVQLVLGGHPETLLDSADIVFVTPGVPRDIPFLRAAESRGVAISSEIELLFEVCPARIAGITGSAGKTTTTSLVGEMVQASGRQTFVGGNIGTPLIDRVEEMTADDWVVLELSSFQLEAMVRSATVGAVLNVTPNHLDRHHTMDEYTRAKSNLIRFQKPGDTAVLGAEDPIARSLASCGAGRKLYFGRGPLPADGASALDGVLRLRTGESDQVICGQNEIRLRGEHNVLNVLAAATVASVCGASVENIRKVATTFAGVEHRIEPVREVDGVTYYNDSIATAPERALAALQTFSEPVVLIAGGRSKHLSLEALASLAVQKCRGIIVMGEMADELTEAIKLAAVGNSLVLRQASSMRDAVEAARQIARKGDAVLLSPAGTSFDQFRDFEERGRVFKRAVHELRTSDDGNDR
jgi:UDP-N-acetylmuramoylalanine--D-glutamate ligase